LKRKDIKDYNSKVEKKKKITNHMYEKKKEKGEEKKIQS
jgi:hypothetical protein